MPDGVAYEWQVSRHPSRAPLSAYSALALSLLWLGCGGSGSDGTSSASSTAGHAASSSGAAVSSTAASASGTGGTGGAGGHGGASSGTGGIGGAGGASVSSTSNSTGTGGTGGSGTGGATSSSASTGVGGAASSSSSTSASTGAGCPTTGATSSSSGTGGLDGGVTSGDPDAGSDAGLDDGGLDGGTDAGLDGGTDGGTVVTSDAGTNCTTQRLRLVAANLTTGNFQSYDPGEGIRILQGIHPDVVMMQEMNYGDDSAAKIQSLASSICAGCTYTRGVGHIPNGIVTRYPILEAGEWTDPSVTDRDFVWARIDIPGPDDLWVVSVHLLTSNTTARNTEATNLLAQLQSKVPAGSLLVIGGDFNSDTRTEPEITTLSARFSTVGPYPVDQLGNEGTNANRKKAYDWVLTSPELRAKEIPVAIGAAMFSAGLVVDTRIYTPIADLAPALASDSGGPSMQHMAVVRDFAVPIAP